MKSMLCVAEILILHANQLALAGLGPDVAVAAFR